MASVRVYTANTTAVTASTTSQTLLALTHGRRSAIIYNDSNKSLCLKYGSGASLTDLSVVIPPGGYYETVEYWVGELSGIWASGANSKAYITEFTE